MDGMCGVLPCVGRQAWTTFARTMQVQITADGFRSIVAMCISGQVGEHYTEIRDGSLLQLADRVAKRCMALCEEREVPMNDDIYHAAVVELAPHFAQPAG